MARCLMQLKELRIVACGVEEIVAQEDGAKAAARLVFPKVTLLFLCKLPKLKWFYQGAHTSEWPLLKHLDVIGCDQIEILISKSLSFQERVEESQLKTSIQQPLFLVEEVAFPSLEALKISHMANLKIIWHNQLVEDSFFKLRLLEVKFCENLMSIFQSNMLIRFQSLEKLLVHDCGSLQEIFELQGQDVGDPQAVTTIPLKELDLRRLPKIKQDLHIVICGVEEIVAQEDGAEAVARLVFPKVTLPFLCKLPKLKWFYQRAHTSE
uniref:Disease resistance protein At4g27190-like leucine-rich repeats domain-containing protein n=1 Tax=Fagus sylvatica TaxID=28930 RepID=A0A2N9IZ14_FAGSY